MSSTTTITISDVWLQRIVYTSEVAVTQNIICYQVKLSKTIIHVTLTNANEIQNKESSDHTCTRLH